MLFPCPKRLVPIIFTGSEGVMCVHVHGEGGREGEGEGGRKKGKEEGREGGKEEGREGGTER